MFLLSCTCFAGITKTYAVPDMVCDHCAKSITKELLKIRGLTQNHIKFNIEQKVVTITFDDNKLLSKTELKTIQFEAGYDLLLK
jgi:copper chaperone CopZ